MHKSQNNENHSSRLYYRSTPNVIICYFSINLCPPTCAALHIELDASFVSQQLSHCYWDYPRNT